MKVQIDYKLLQTKIKDYMDYVYNRDISVLSIIKDEKYREGLQQMEYLLNKDPDKKIINDFAEVFVLAKNK